MRQRNTQAPQSAEETVRDIRRAARRHFSAEEKIRIVLENYYLPGDLESAVATFVNYYNHRRYHESLENLAPADVYFGRAARILARRRNIKQQTIEHHCRQHFNAAAWASTRWSEPSLRSAAQMTRKP